MPRFVHRQLEASAGFGNKLRLARQMMNITIDEAASKTSIRKEYLLAIEEERIDALPAGLYGKSFMKKYSAFLGVRTNEAESAWQKQEGSSIGQNPFSQKIVAKKKFIIFPRIFRNIGLIVLTIFCLLYLLFYAKNIATEPKLEIYQPEKNMLTKESVIEVIGLSEAEAEVKINGEAVLNNQDGYFRQTINLKAGQNNIVISAKKKYGRESVITRQILVEK